jgi:hypothetical protein
MAGRNLILANGIGLPANGIGKTASFVARGQKRPQPFDHDEALVRPSELPVRQKTADDGSDKH